MKVLTKRELERSEDNFAEVFRGNSVGCKVVSQYFALVGRDWAKACIQPAVSLLAKKPPKGTAPRSYEIDPAQATGDINLALANMTELVNLLLDTVFGSVMQAPPKLKSLCYGIKSTLMDSHPQLASKVLGNIIVLRFLGPLMTTPEDVGFPLAEGELRALRLAAKVLTNLANGILFGTKEEYMAPFNALLQARTEAHKFYAEMATENLAWEDGRLTSEREKEEALKEVFQLNNRFVASQYSEFDLRPEGQGEY